MFLRSARDALHSVLEVSIGRSVELSIRREAVKRPTDQCTSRRVDESTPCIGTGNRSLLKDKSQSMGPTRRWKDNSGRVAASHGDCLAGTPRGNAVDFPVAGEVRISGSVTMSGLCRRGEHAVRVAQAGDAGESFQPNRNCAACGAVKAQAPRPLAQGPAGSPRQPPHRIHLLPCYRSR